MSFQVGIESIEGLAEVRERLGDSGKVRSDTARVLNQAARIGVQSAKIYAPKRTSELAEHIREDSIQFTVAESVIEARFGVDRVFPRGVGARFKEGSQKYPVYVHEGTGLYGRLKRLITPKRASHMQFLGRTGWVVAKTVRGQRPQPYMRDAYLDARAYIEAHLDDMVERLVR